MMNIKETGENLDAYIFSTSTAMINTWGEPFRIDTIENGDTIEIIYKEASNTTHTIHFNTPPKDRVFKIIFSCIDGKWNKSEPIYGEIEQATEETYNFD